MITEKEKEELFEEFRERIEHENSVAYLRKKNFKPARDYFDERYAAYRKIYKKPRTRTNNYIWTIISQMMCRAEGHEYVHKIKQEHLERVNKFGMQITDLYFDFLIANAVKGENK